MRFWDSSALVTLLLEQPRSAHARSLAVEDAELVVWWGWARSTTPSPVSPVRLAEAFEELLTSDRQLGEIRRGERKPSRSRTFEPAAEAGVIQTEA